MQVASVGSAMQANVAKTPEVAEGPGPDHDGDSDDKGSSVKSLTAPGVGGQVAIPACLTRTRSACRSGERQAYFSFPPLRGSLVLDANRGGRQMSCHDQMEINRCARPRLPCSALS